MDGMEELIEPLAEIAGEVLEGALGTKWGCITTLILIGVATAVYFIWFN